MARFACFYEGATHCKAYDLTDGLKIVVPSIQNYFKKYHRRKLQVLVHELYHPVYSQIPMPIRAI